MSSLAASLSDYLVLRRALGCKLITAEALLRQFVAHCDARGLTVITSEVAVAWAMLPAGAALRGGKFASARSAPSPAGCKRSSRPRRYRRSMRSGGSEAGERRRTSTPTMTSTR